MATPLRIPGGSYVDARLDRCYAGIRGSVIQTHDGDIPAFGAALPFFLRTNDDGPFEFAGQASADFAGTLIRRGNQWIADPRIATVNGVIYDRAGVLRVWTGGPHQSSQGFRYVAPDGTLVMGDATIFRDGLNEWTDLSDAQDGSILIGQGNASGGVVVKIDGILRQLHAGPCRAIHARQRGGAVVVAFYVEGDAGYVYWLTLDDLRALPVLRVEPPHPAPDPTPEEPPMPVPVDNAAALRIVEQERAKYGPSLTPSEQAQLLRNIATALNAAGLAGGPFGVLKKESGSNCDGISCDIICSGNDLAQRQWDVLLGNETHDPRWDEKGEGINIRECVVPTGGTPTPPDPPDPPDPDPDPSDDRLDALERLVTRLLVEKADLANRISALEQRPTPTPGEGFDHTRWVASGEVTIDVPFFGKQRKTVTLPIIRKP